GGFAEARRDELELALVRGDVARRINAGPTRFHAAIDHDFILLEREPPLAQRAEIADIAEHGQHHIADNLDRFLRLDILERDAAHDLAIEGVYGLKLVERVHGHVLAGGSGRLDFCYRCRVRTESVAAM